MRQIALVVVAPGLRQPLALRGVLHALCHNPKPQIVSQADERPHQRFGGAVHPDASGETAVDFHRIDR